MICQSNWFDFIQAIVHQLLPKEIAWKQQGSVSLIPISEFNLLTTSKVIRTINKNPTASRLVLHLQGPVASPLPFALVSPSIQLYFKYTTSIIVTGQPSNVIRPSINSSNNPSDAKRRLSSDSQHAQQESNKQPVSPRRTSQSCANVSPLTRLLFHNRKKACQASKDMGGWEECSGCEQDGRGWRSFSICCLNSVIQYMLPRIKCNIRIKYVHHRVVTLLCICHSIHNNEQTISSDCFMFLEWVHLYSDSSVQCFLTRATHLSRGITSSSFRV